ncbi:MAG: hypothetical protein MJ133_03590 [Lachnospiraceae bacterium]|nr:hypothetical protein [Lachnospiraceae bacterium]
MINEEKVILMTKLAAFEKREGRKDNNILSYFRSDYIGFQILKAVIAGTISFFAVLVVYVFYNFETLMADIYKMDFMEMGKSIVTIYLIVIVIYAVLCYILYAYRYSKAKRRLKTYYMNLRKLDNLNSR